MFLPGLFAPHQFNRRCTNRVVEKGLNYRLEVFRVAQTDKNNSDSSASSTSSSSSSAASTQNNNTWGVRTLDFIPQNAFVCEVTGQFLLGSKFYFILNFEMCASFLKCDFTGVLLVFMTRFNSLSHGC